MKTFYIKIETNGVCEKICIIGAGEKAQKVAEGLAEMGDRMIQVQEKKIPKGNPAKIRYNEGTKEFFIDDDIKIIDYAHAIKEMGDFRPGEILEMGIHYLIMMHALKSKHESLVLQLFIAIEDAGYMTGSKVRTILDECEFEIQPF